MNPRRTAGEERVIEHIMLAGWGCEFRADPAAARNAAADALHRWIQEGLPFARLANGGRAFDPAEVVNFAKTLGLAGRDDFWASRYVRTGRRLAGDFGAKPDELEPRNFAIGIQRGFNLEHHSPGTRVRLRVPFPAQDATITSLHAALPPDTRSVPGYAETFVTVSGDRTPSIHVTYRFVASAARTQSDAALDASETELYLRRSEGLVNVTPRVAALARELAGNAGSQLDALRAFWSFFFARMTLGVLHGDDTIDTILDSGWFDCRVGSALLVALCRARGIPARMCSGFTLYALPFYHYWAEVWLGGRGWFPADLVCWDLSMRGADEEWREYFFGALDYRMTVEVLPRTFTGFPSIRLPRTWHVLSRALPAGAAFGLFAAESGDLVYEDRVAVNVNAGPLLP